MTWCNLLMHIGLVCVDSTVLQQAYAHMHAAATGPGHPWPPGIVYVMGDLPTACFNLYLRQRRPVYPLNPRNPIILPCQQLPCVIPGKA